MDECQASPKGPSEDANAFETPFAKEARERNRCRGKPLDCSKRGIMRIRVRTKWQSSPVAGNTTETNLKGNRQPGDRPVFAWENLLDLSRKIYSLCCHPGALLIVHTISFFIFFPFQWDDIILIYVIILIL